MLYCVFVSDPNDSICSACSCLVLKLVSKISGIL
ncbi:hypothetical protein SLEP1_g21296 [Rubroshorea leprosula]|uniref:Uncharacterized protein n=1 Tax=Rubroshorea leprosula TaxID=152421 RepID=A0AAV5JE89_9ROSI|nr:hypothetical protein SLEP1_g21296 [Rubroshorea leprosula]